MRAILTAIAFLGLGASAFAQPASNVSHAAMSAMPTCTSGDPVVWVNTKSKVMYVKGSTLYGKTVHGKYVCLSQAKTMGAHAPMHGAMMNSGSMSHGSMGSMSHGSMGATMNPGSMSPATGSVTEGGSSTKGTTAGSSGSMGTSGTTSTGSGASSGSQTQPYPAATYLGNPTKPGQPAGPSDNNNKNAVSAPTPKVSSTPTN